MRVDFEASKLIARPYIRGCAMLFPCHGWYEGVAIGEDSWICRAAIRVRSNYDHSLVEGLRAVH